MYFPGKVALVIGVGCNSVNLYVVIFTINCAIYTLYVVFVLFFPHLSVTVYQRHARTHLEARPCV
jgi:hypothetical protein